MFNFFTNSYLKISDFGNGHPLRVTIVKRFTSKNAPKLPGLPRNNSQQPIHPSSLSKTPKPSNVSKPVPTQARTVPSTNAPKQLSPQKPSGYLFKEYQSTLDKPHIKNYLESKQSSTTTSTTTTTKGPSLTPSTGAVVLYKQPKVIPIQNNMPIIYIDKQGKAIFDINTTSLPIPSPMPLNPITETTTSTTIHSNNYSDTMSNTIPTPPPMPSKPFVKTDPVEPITEEVLVKAKNKLKPQIPEDTKIPNLSHVEPQVVLDKASELAKKLSNSDVIKEMLDRKLFTKDNAMPIEVMTETGDIILIGKGTEYKLTGIGYAYLKKINKPLYIENTSIKNDKQNYNFCIAMVKHIKDCFLNSTDQTHMLVVYNINDNTCFSLGYLTSKPTEIKLGDIQFKIYQDIKDGSNMLSNKPQFFAFYDNAKQIPMDQSIFLKGGSDYIQYLDKTTTLNILNEKSFC